MFICRYVPKEYLDLESELPPQGVQKVNSLNMELVKSRGAAKALVKLHRCAITDVQSHLNLGLSPIR